MKQFNSIIEIGSFSIKTIIFSNENNAGFYLSGKNSEKMIVRSITGYDGAIPSGNSIIAMNLVRLSKMTGEIKWIDIAENLFKTFSLSSLFIDPCIISTLYFKILLKYLYFSIADWWSIFCDSFISGQTQNI